jgi:ABC-type transport system involved in multi-copper enzyme maturation permease subunit
MTAPAVAPYRAPQRRRGDGFWPIVRSEWTKFRTLRGWVLGLILAAILIDVIGLLVIRPSAPCSGRGGCLPAVPVGPGGEAVNDSFYFVGQRLTGNGTITVAVTSLTGSRDASGQTGGPVTSAGPGVSATPAMQRGAVPWAKAGIIITRSTRPGAAYAAMMVTASHGVRMQYNYAADAAGLPGWASSSAPRWLRLTRAGDAITGYDSADGRHWAKVGTADLTGLAASVRIGLFVTSPLRFTPNLTTYAQSGGSVSPSVATGVFDHLSLSGQAAGRWAGQQVGTSNGMKVGYRQSGGRYTITGAGDIGPVVGGAANSFYDTGTISDHLLGIFVGLILMVVIAAMFITAEYRRGLIRTTLAASPRRGRVLAAKAVVVGLATFVAGTAAAAVAAIAGVAVSRSGNVYVLPASLATEARVIVGAGALLGVASVLSMAVGAILRRGAATVAAVIVTIVLPYLLGAGGVLPVGLSEWILRVSPAAAFAVEQSTPQYSQVIGQYGPPEYFPIAPLAGLAVLCAYAAVALALATWMLRRRDA